MSHRIEEEYWPELKWIQDPDLRENTQQTRLHAFERRPWARQDLRGNSSSLQVEGCNVSFSTHQRFALQLACESALKMHAIMGDDEPVDQDFLLAGPILANGGEQSGYEMNDGNGAQSFRGADLRPPMYFESFVKSSKS